MRYIYTFIYDSYNIYLGTSTAKTESPSTTKLSTSRGSIPTTVTKGASSTLQYTSTTRNDVGLGNTTKPVSSKTKGPESSTSMGIRTTLNGGTITL